MGVQGVSWPRERRGILGGVGDRILMVVVGEMRVAEDGEVVGEEQVAEVRKVAGDLKATGERSTLAEEITGGGGMVVGAGWVIVTTFEKTGVL